jgi:hypothetical protein
MTDPLSATKGQIQTEDHLERHLPVLLMARVWAEKLETHQRTLDSDLD